MARVEPVTKWAMASRERLLAAMRREDVDHVPLSASFLDLVPEMRAGRRYQFPWEPSQREKVDYLAVELGLDPTVDVWIGAYYPEPGVIAEVWIDDLDHIHKVWHTPSGDLEAAVSCDEQWPHALDIPFFSDFNSAHFVRPWIESAADVDKLAHILVPPRTERQLDEIRFHYRQARSLADRHHLATIAHVGMGLTGALQLFGAEGLCLMAIEQPDVVDAFLELEHRRNLGQLEVLLDLGLDIVHRNGYYETCDFYSPAMLDRFLGRRLAREIETAHQGGALVKYTAHTGLMPMLDYLARLEFDSLAHFDLCFHATDPMQVRERLGGSKSFWVGPCNTHCTFSPDPEVVRQAVRQAFEVFGRTGLVLSSSSAIISSDPWANSLAMIEEWRRLR